MSIKFNKKNQSIPKVFLEKIEIDKIVDKMKKEKVVSMKEVTKAVWTQRAKRQACAGFIAMAKGVPPINGGSSGAGEVFTPTKLEAVA